LAEDKKASLAIIIVVITIVPIDHRRDIEARKKDQGRAIQTAEEEEEEEKKSKKFYWKCLSSNKVRG
jgi:hypothetical protein